MSLAPKEQRALAGIEDSLSRSDPRLATMLATFTVPSSRGRIPRWKALPPGRSRIRRFIPVTLATALTGLAVLGGLLLSHPSQQACTPRSGGVTAFRLIIGCQPGGSPPRHSKRAAGNGSAAAPPAPGIGSSGPKGDGAAAAGAAGIAAGHALGMAAWQWGQVAGGSASVMVPHAGQTRFSQQAGSPGTSSSGALSVSSCRASFIARAAAFLLAPPPGCAGHPWRP